MTEARQRGFEIIKEFQGKDIALPERKTAASAGYDLQAALDCIVPSGEMTMVPTGLKAYMQPDEVLAIHIRSSLAVRQKLMLMNSVGVVDADYYNNPDNEGHILIAFWNPGKESVAIKKGERIAQGIFQKYLTVDGDRAGMGLERLGGFGSTGHK